MLDHQPSKSSHVPDTRTAYAPNCSRNPHNLRLFELIRSSQPRIYRNYRFLSFSLSLFHSFAYSCKFAKSVSAIHKFLCMLTQRFSSKNQRNPLWSKNFHQLYQKPSQHFHTQTCSSPPAAFSVSHPSSPAKSGSNLLRKDFGHSNRHSRTPGCAKILKKLQTVMPAASVEINLL